MKLPPEQRAAVYSKARGMLDNAEFELPDYVPTAIVFLKPLTDGTFDSRTVSPLPTESLRDLFAWLGSKDKDGEDALRIHHWNESLDQDGGGNDGV